MRISTGSLSGGTSCKEPDCQCRRHKRLGFNPWVGEIPWRRKWQPTPVFLLGESHGQRSLAGYSPWDCKESDMTEHTRAHTLTHTHTRVKPTALKRLATPYILYQFADFVENI